jgi:hypothetical protein
MPKIENPALFVWDAAAAREYKVLVQIYCNIVRIINFKTARNGAHPKINRTGERASAAKMKCKNGAAAQACAAVTS